MKVIAHALGNGQPYEQAGIWLIPLIVETEHGRVEEVDVAFSSYTHVAEVQKYFRSTEGMKPIEFEV